MEHKDQKARGFFCTLVGAVSWGFSGTCSQYLFMNYDLDSGWLAVVRMLISGLLMSLYMGMRQRKAAGEILRQPSDRVKLLGFSLAGLMLCQYSYLMAIHYTNAGTATVLQYVGPVFVMGYACIRGLRLPKKTEAAAIVLAVAGTFLLATHGNIHTMVLSEEGLFWGMVAAVALFFYTVIPRGLIQRFGSIVVTGYGMLIGGIVLFFSLRIWRVEVFLDTRGIFAVAVVVIVGTLMSFTLYLQGVSDIGPVKASMLASIEPVAAALFSALWLGTEFSAMDILGFLCILTTVFLLAKK
ncbi:MAG: DMT family transporter [Blautia sp.]|jgi:drug/metabolite transporter (DMT)-like permease